MTVGEIYLESAAVTTDFLSRPVVASRWDAPSALPMLRIGGLTAHLVGQLTQVPPVLDAPVVNEQVSLAEHFAMSTWTDGIIDSDVNTYIRRAAEEDARLGAEALNAAASDALATLRRRLPGESPDRVIQLPWGPWALTLDDYLVTRLLELAVHCDDLAASLGVPAPALPAGCWEAAIGELSRMAARRHGPSAVIRALSRAERAPRTIAAI